MKLENQSVVVYAGARSIGKGFCETLLQKGCKVCIGDILEKVGEETKDELQAKYGKDRVIFHLCDVTNEAQVESLLEKAVSAFGSVNIVIANAGITNERDWFRTMDVNTGGVIRAFNACLKHMSLLEGGKGGAFVATSSIAGIRPSKIPIPIYSTSKHAVVGFIRHWGDEENFKLTGIRTSAICPAIVDTGLVQALPPGGLAMDKQLEKWNPIIEAMDRDKLVSVDEVSAALVQVLEDDTSSGKCLLVTRQSGTKYAEFQQWPDF